MAMACEVYEKLQKEYGLADDEWKTLATPQNSSMIAKAQLVRLLNDAETKKRILENQMFLHRQSCSVCKTAAGQET